MFDLKQADFRYALLAAFIFAIVTISIPIYDSENGLHNIFLNNYKITWADGRSPINFFLIKNLISNKGISFPGNFTFNGIAAKDNYDFFEYNGTYFPMFNLRPIFLFSLILKPLQYASDIVLYKSIVLLVIIFYSASLFIFYFVQRKLGLKKNIAFFSTIVGGLATSFIIYSHYFFLTEVISTFFFLIFFFFLLKYLNKNSRIASYLLPITFFIFIFFFILFSFFAFVMILIIFYFAYFRNRAFHSWKIFALLFVLLYIGSLFYLTTGIEGPIVNGSGQIKFFQIFPYYIDAADFNIYGYHNVSSVNDRVFSYIYSFEQKPGNALFVQINGLFGSLFREKGFVYNSIFLIFSIFGIFYYKNKEKRNLILAFLIVFLAFFSLRMEWYGGFTPRYVRSFEIPILLLTFFSFYFIQENKNKLVLLIFIFLVLISFLNVLSLAVRTDWTYEHIADLVSYDLVLWPFTPTNVIEQPNDLLQLNLVSKTEQTKWDFGGEYYCRAVSEDGIKTDPCDCQLNSWADRSVSLPWNTTRINITVCAGVAGNDGTKGSIFLNNNLLDTIFIQSYQCSSKSYIQKITPGTITIRLKSGIYGNCSGDMTFWKFLSIEKS